MRAPFGGGQHAEAGGEYIDTGHRNLLAYVPQFGLKTEDVRVGPRGLETAAYYGGRRRTYDQYFPQKIVDETDDFWSAMDDFDPEPALDYRTVASVMDKVDLSPRARELVTIDIRDDYDVEPGKLSLLFAVSEGDPNQGDARIEPTASRSATTRCRRRSRPRSATRSRCARQ